MPHPRTAALNRRAALGIATLLLVQTVAAAERIRRPAGAQDGAPIVATMHIDAAAAVSARTRPAAQGPLTQGTTTVVVDEDFEGAFPTGLWITPPDGGAGLSGCQWGKSDALADAGAFSISPVAGGCANQPDPLTGPLPPNAQIFVIYGPFDLSSAVAAELTYRSAQQLEGGDDLFVGHINDPFCSGSYAGFASPGGSLNWLDGNLDLSTQAGNADVCVVFALRTDGVSAVGNEAVFLDNVQISYTNAPTNADLELSLIDAQNGLFAPGDTIVIHNVTENVGTETSTIYDIDFYASLDTDITAADVHLGGFTSGALEPGEVDEFFDSVTLPGNLQTTSWFIGGILTVNDANDANNRNFDPLPITVSDEPDIRVRPLNLDFVDPGEASPASTATVMAAGSSGEGASAPPAALDQAALQATLLDKLRLRAMERGRVRLILTLAVGFSPEARLAPDQARNQRAAIRAAGDRLQSEVQGLGATVRRRFERLPLMAVTADALALEQLARSPLVHRLEEDRPSRPHLASSTAVIGAPLAWAEGFDGAGQAVAVLDTGVDHGHSWFTAGGSRLVAEGCYSTTEADVSASFCPGGVASSTAPGSGTSCDPLVGGCDHGTHVAGIALGNDALGPDYGVARGADLIAMQVFSKFLTEFDCGVGEAPCPLSLTSDQIAALERVLALSAGLDIAAVNMSLGGGTFTDQASCDAANGSIKLAIDSLRAAGIATVISAGNDGWVDAISAPGCVSSAISVGATTDRDNVAGFSNIYPQIHLLAPGVNVISATPGEATDSKQGTSMAAPHVAGALAVLRQREPAATVDELLATLQGTATLVDDLRNDGIETGLARINVDLALGTPRRTFGIFNDGPGTLTVSGVAPQTAAPWISIDPAPPYTLERGELQVVDVLVDYDQAPNGLTQTRLLVTSNDPDESTYPGGVFVNVTASNEPGPEFDSVPAAGALLGFPDTLVGTTSAPLVITVSNSGDADLTLSCARSGSEPAQFAIVACPGLVAPAGATEISVACNPDSLGPKLARLDVTTNDANETFVSYDLACTGSHVIHASGFEGAD